MGSASFVAGDIGQRIILKSGFPYGCQAEIIIKSNVDIDKTNDNECEYE
jgi:hypothetical protein